MKILLVSMPSLHFFRWTEQLEHAGHDVYWFDILDGSPTERLPWVEQYKGWKLKYPNLKGRHFVKKKFPKTYKKLGSVIENDTAKTFEDILLKVKPDVVHSFVLYIACAPILEVMQKYNTIKWIYSSWGSDLYYYKNIPEYKSDILKVLPRVNYLITDCKRDVGIAKDLGFSGTVLGTFPGGGGFDYSNYNAYITTPAIERKIILVKGYQGRSGRCIEVLKALVELKEHLTPFKVIVFGASDEVITYTNETNTLDGIDLEVFSIKQFLPHSKILELMGKALLYIGNSNSDGMPNTLLEAVAQGAFPIQSNPGGASEDVITDGKSGLLISDCNDITHIKNVIFKALSDKELISEAFHINQTEIKPKYEIEHIKTQVLKAYNSITN